MVDDIQERCRLVRLCPWNQPSWAGQFVVHINIRPAVTQVIRIRLQYSPSKNARNDWSWAHMSLPMIFSRILRNVYPNPKVDLKMGKIHRCQYGFWRKFKPSTIWTRRKRLGSSQKKCIQWLLKLL